MNPLKVPQQGTYEERYPFTGLFYISVESLIKIPLNKKFFPSLKGPKKRMSLHVPQNWGSCGNKTPISRALLNISFGVPSRGALPPGPPQGTPSERDAPFLEPSFIHLAKSLVYESPSRFPSAIKGPLWREMLIPRAFLYLSSRIPTRGGNTPLQRPSPLSLFRERCSTSRAPFIHLSKSLVDELQSRFPSKASMERDAHLQSLPFITFRVPSKGALPPGSLYRAPTERDPSLREPLSTVFPCPWYVSPLQVAQLSPHEERCPSPEPSFHNIQGPQQRSLPPGAPNRASIKSDVPFPEPSFHYLS